MYEQEENDNSTQESGPESSPSNDMKMASTSSPKRSKKAMQRRIVSVPIKDLEGPRLKGENASPPSDSWAWRKYGQKPIKGSPYPRYVTLFLLSQIQSHVFPLFIFSLFLLTCSDASGQVLSIPEGRKTTKIRHKKLRRRRFAAKAILL